jgi:hypothetical protein
VKYLKEGIKEGNPFLSLHEFGPFDMRNMGHMKIFGEVILAYTLQMNSLHRERFDQVAEESSSMGATDATSFTGIVPMRRAITYDTQAHPRASLSGPSHVGIHSTSDDPRTLVRPLSELAVSEPLTPATAKEPRRSSRLKSSMQRVFGSPRAKPS